MTQNEKDRAFIDECLRFMKNEDLFVGHDLTNAIFIADRLLTERENAETVYKFNPVTDGVKHEFSRENVQAHRVVLSREDLTPIYGKKGIWIADVDGEGE